MNNSNYKVDSARLLQAIAKTQNAITLCAEENEYEIDPLATGESLQICGEHLFSLFMTLDELGLAAIGLNDSNIEVAKESVLITQRAITCIKRDEPITEQSEGILGMLASNAINQSQTAITLTLQSYDDKQ